MIRAFLEAAPVFQDATLTEFALKTIGRLIDQLLTRNATRCIITCQMGCRNFRGLLADQVGFAEALLQVVPDDGRR